MAIALPQRGHRGRVSSGEATANLPLVLIRLDLEHATTDLVFLDGLEKRAEIAFAEALVPFPLDELEEDRADDCPGKDLQQDLCHAAVDYAFAVNKDAVFFHPFEWLIVA